MTPDMLRRLAKILDQLDKANITMLGFYDRDGDEVLVFAMAHEVRVAVDYIGLDGKSRIVRYVWAKDNQRWSERNED